MAIINLIKTQRRRRVIVFAIAAASTPFGNRRGSKEISWINCLGSRSHTVRAKCALAAAFEVDPDLLRRMAAAATVAMH